MPTVQENLKYWDKEYEWADQGNVWSLPWGNANTEWAVTIAPRIQPALPAGRVLEIASGFGRWTPFLLAHCTSYVGIDISARAVEHCRATFRDRPQSPLFLVGDGWHFPDVEDGSVDFVFSFDSLVHVELDCLRSYIAESARCLSPGAYAFLHHSNLAEIGVAGKNPGWRATSVSAETVLHAAEEAGLQVLVQEKTRWVFGLDFCDCFTLLRKPSVDEAAPERRIFRNEKFQDEVAYAATVARRYAPADDQPHDSLAPPMSEAPSPAAPQAPYADFLAGLLSERDLHYRNAYRVLSIVREILPFRRVVDIGCGIGAWMAAAQRLGADTVHGFDGPWVDSLFASQRTVLFDNGRSSIRRDQIISLDLSTQDPPDLMHGYDLAISIEVAEHLPEERADALVNILVSASEHVLFSAATPGQGGFAHINEQPLGYWASKFWARHFVPVEIVRPAITWNDWMHFWLRRNLVMFVNYAALLRNPALQPLARSWQEITRPWP